MPNGDLEKMEVRPQSVVERYENIIRSNLANIQIWRAEGFSADQIAYKLGLPNRQTLYLFMRKMPELKAAWEYADPGLLLEFIEPAIKDRAQNGFRYIEETEELLRDADGNPVLDENMKPMYAVTKRVHKVAPCNNLLQLMAKQLDKPRWGNKVEKDAGEGLELADDMKEYVE